MALLEGLNNLPTQSSKKPTARAMIQFRAQIPATGSSFAVHFPIHSSSIRNAELKANSRFWLLCAFFKLGSSCETCNWRQKRFTRRSREHQKGKNFSALRSSAIQIHFPIVYFNEQKCLTFDSIRASDECRDWALNAEQIPTTFLFSVWLLAMLAFCAAN